MADNLYNLLQNTLLCKGNQVCMAVLVGCIVSMYHLSLPVGWEDLRVRNLYLESKLKLVGDTFLPVFPLGCSKLTFRLKF